MDDAEEKPESLRYDYTECEDKIQDNRTRGLRVDKYATNDATRKIQGQTTRPLKNHCRQLCQQLIHASVIIRARVAFRPLFSAYHHLLPVHILPQAIPFPPHHD